MIFATTNSEGYVELPSYSDVPDRTSNNVAFRTKHSYSLRTAKGKPWLSLHIPNRAISANVLPAFRDGDEISGEVKIDLEKPESFKDITVGIVAKLIVTDFDAFVQESVPFIDLSTTLWSPSSISAKLSGAHTWPFMLALPKEAQVATSSNEPPMKYPLPPTFRRQASHAYIDYRLIVTVKKGMFKGNQTLGTSFALVPQWVAPLPSPLRVAAYRDGSPLIGPERDPDGWKILPPIKIPGTLSDTKDVEIEATLALATPLSYALGSPIPLLLTLKCADSRALDLLSQTSAISVYLTRVTEIGSTATDDIAPRRSNKTFLERKWRAYWWPSEEGAPQDGVRVLQGEIDLPKILEPGFIFPWLSIRYYVTLSVFSTPGFVSAIPKDQHLLSKKVSIVTVNPPGVIPRSHAPPGYVKPSVGNYNNSMRLLGERKSAI